MAWSTPTTRTPLTHRMTHNQPQQQPHRNPTVCPRTAELSIKPARRHTPAVSPRPAAPGRQDHPPVLLILRDVPLGDQARILALNKHLLRRLNNAADQSIIAAHTHAHAQRGNKSRTITLLLTTTLLRLPIPARQNLTEMPINHLRRLQRIPPSLLRRNISDQKTERSDRATPFGEVTRKPYWVNVRSKDVGLSLPSVSIRSGRVGRSRLRLFWARVSPPRPGVSR